jgi:hypothetical protein
MDTTVVKAAIVEQAANALRRARALPVGPARNDLRRIAQLLLALYRAGIARKRPNRRGADQALRKAHPGESYEGGVSARGRHQITDRSNNLTGAIWLGQEATTGWQMLFTDIAQAGRGYDLDGRPASPDRDR